MHENLKPLLIFDGNCQSQNVAAVFRGIGAADVAYVGEDYGFVPSWNGVGCPIVMPETASELARAAAEAGRPVLQVSQVTPLARAVSLPTIAHARGRVLFPNVRFYTLSEARFVEAYKTAKAPRRVFEMDHQSILYAQNKASFPVDVAAYIRDQSTSRSLFHTINHPSGAVLAQLVRGIAQQFSSVVDLSAVEASLHDVESREGLNFKTDHPIRRSTMTELGFEWGPEYATYAEMVMAIRRQEWTTLLDRRDEFTDLFSNDTQLWRGYALASRALGPEIDLGATEALLEMNPGHSMVWSWYCEHLVATGRHAEVESTLERAAAYFEGANAFERLAAVVHLKYGDPDAAEHHARTHFRRAPEVVESLFPLVQVLVRKRQHQEIRSIILSQADRPPKERARIAAFLDRARTGVSRQEFEAATSPAGGLGATAVELPVRSGAASAKDGAREERVAVRRRDRGVARANPAGAAPGEME